MRESHSAQQQNRPIRRKKKTNALFYKESFDLIFMTFFKWTIFQMQHKVLD